MSRSVTLRGLATFALVSCACLAPADPIIAQSSSALDRPRVSFTSVHQYVAAEAIPRQLATPPNLVVSSMYRPLVESMLRQSPTFRRQCVRIAAERSLTVHLAITKPSPGYDVRATTRITRDEKGHLSAAIRSHLSTTWKSSSRTSSSTSSSSSTGWISARMRRSGTQASPPSDIAATCSRPCARNARA